MEHGGGPDLWLFFPLIAVEDGEAQGRRMRRRGEFGERGGGAHGYAGPLPLHKSLEQPQRFGTGMGERVMSVQRSTKKRYQYQSTRPLGCLLVLVVGAGVSREVPRNAAMHRAGVGATDGQGPMQVCNIGSPILVMQIAAHQWGGGARGGEAAVAEA